MRGLLISVAVLGAISAGAGAAPQEYNRGDQVRVNTVDGQPADPPVQRIIGVPGDRIKIDGKTLTVNDRAIADISPQLILACGSWDDTVRAGHYFLVGEQLQGVSASRACSLLPASRIVGGVQR